MVEAADLTRRRCAYHPAREAAVRCLECRRDVCRECATEHGDRFLCADCLRRLSAPRPSTGRRLAGLAPFGGLALGLLVAWIYFHLVGLALLMIPSTFHPAGAVLGAQPAATPPKDGSP